MILIIEIIELALGVLKNSQNGQIQKDAALAGVFVQIVQKAAAAYEAHAGQPLDLSLIKPEAPI